MVELTKPLIEILTYLVTSYGYFAVFVLMTLESALVPIPSEITMTFAGFLAGRGIFNFWFVVFVGALGNLAGSLLAYWLGAAKGETWVRIVIKRWGKWLLIREEEFDKAKEWFKKYGQGVTFISRILPIVRTFISLPAGIAKMNLLLFSVLTFIGSFIWSGVLAYLGLALGENWQAVEPYFRKFQLVIVIVFLAGVVFYIWIHLKRRKN